MVFLSKIVFFRFVILYRIVVVVAAVVVCGCPFILQLLSVHWESFERKKKNQKNYFNYIGKWSGRTERKNVSTIHLNGYHAMTNVYYCVLRRCACFFYCCCCYFFLFFSKSFNDPSCSKNEIHKQCLKHLVNVIHKHIHIQ